MNPTDTDDRGSPEPDRVAIRDLDRIREKVTLSVEPRHAIFAGIGGVLLLVAAFLTGLILGRSCDQGTVAPTPSAKGDRGLMVASAGPLAEVSTPPSPVRGHPLRPPRTVRPVLVVRGPSLDADPPRRGPVEVPESRPKGTIEDAPWPPFGVSDPCTGVSCGMPQGCGAPGPTPSEVRLAVQRHSRNHLDFWRRQAWFAGQVLHSAANSFVRGVLAAVRESSAVASSHPTRPLPAPVAPPYDPPRARATALASGVFTVQVRSYRDESLAREFAQSLKSQGYSVEVARHDDDAGQPWFRVRVGRFPTLAEARDFAHRLNERTGDQAIVTAMEAR